MGQATAGLAGGLALLAGLAAAAPAGAQGPAAAIPAAPEVVASGALPGMSAREAQAQAIWSLRAGLNVAALQCSFSKAYRTVENYNAFLRQHSDELAGAVKTLAGYFNRTEGARAGPRANDRYNTRLYQGYSTLEAQYAFCDRAALIAREALAVPKGQLGAFVETRLPLLRQTLTANHRDEPLARTTLGYLTLPDLAAGCRARGKPPVLRC